MKFSIFKKEKSKENKKPGTGEDADVQLTDLEEELNNNTNNLKEKQKQLESLSDNGERVAGNEDETIAPHGPIEELMIEPSDKDDTPLPEVAADAVPFDEEAGEEIKVVEVKADAGEGANDTQAEAPPPSQDEKKDDTLNQSFNSLFQSEEEEENPLINLIKGLPDVSAEELVKDLNEIKEIIKEWQKKT